MTFYIRDATPHTGPWYLDDIYIDHSGANLSDPVPEPPTGLLLVLGAMSMCGLSRKKSS